MENIKMIGTLLETAKENKQKVKLSVEYGFDETVEEDSTIESITNDDGFCWRIVDEYLTDFYGCNVTVVRILDLSSFSSEDIEDVADWIIDTRKHEIEIMSEN